MINPRRHLAWLAGLAFGISLWCYAIWLHCKPIKHVRRKPDFADEVMAKRREKKLKG